MHTLYLGPSWAVQSFESVQGLDDPVKTNIAQELQLTNYTSLARYAESNFKQLDRAQQFITQHPELAPFRIVFVMANTLEDGYKIHQMSQLDFVKKFLLSNDPIGIVKDLENLVYQKLRNVNLPIALIGAHTDVGCESHDNITVIHKSWQQFLGQHAGLNNFYGWPVEIGHRWLQGLYSVERGPMAEFSVGRDPSPNVVFEIHKLFNIWNILVKKNLFKGSHPSILGNQLFAKEIKNSIHDWFDKYQ